MTEKRIPDEAAGGVMEPARRWEVTDAALTRIQWAYETLHLSQTAFIKRLIDLPLSDFLGCHKSASTVKSYLQGNIPKTTPELIDKLVLAAACFFNMEPHHFFDASLDRNAFVDRLRSIDDRNNRALCALSQENEHLKAKVTSLESRLEEKTENPGGNKAETAIHAEQNDSHRDKWYSASPFKSMALILGLLVFGVLLAWGVYSPDDPYPPRRAPEISRATLDGRDLELNTVTSPMMVTYGSNLCVLLASEGMYASAFIEDRGFYFNQEGRLLIAPHDQEEKCTGIWPGIPDTFRKSPYKLFIVVSADRLPVTGDADRRMEIPEGSYFGPIYIQRTE